MERYMQEVIRKGVTVYRYNPPKLAATEEVVVPKYLGADKEAATLYCMEQNILLDEWRKEGKRLLNLTEQSTVGDVIKAYKLSHFFERLEKKTKTSYTDCLNSWYDSKVGGKSLLSCKLKVLTTPLCQNIYDDHVGSSITQANHSLAVFKVVFSYAVNRGYITRNAFSGVIRSTSRPRKVVWEREHVRAFLNVAFSRFEWRNIGIIVNMAYEWGQRLGDMRNLKWEQYNLETGVLTLVQSKRRAKVTLPTSKGLQVMLEQQHKEFGWQQYIAPSGSRGKDRKFIPFSIQRVSLIGNKIMVEAGLPDELMLMDLRRTAITEMVEHGVPLPSIMALSGHSSPNSLTPYIKHTLAGASNAQTMRNFPQELL